MDMHAVQNCTCPDENTTCTSVSTQYADVSLAIKAKPQAVVGAVETDCCGEPVITVRQAGGCGRYEIVITQSVCIKIPVAYSTTVETGEISVNCRRAPESDCKPSRI